MTIYKNKSITMGEKHCHIPIVICTDGNECKEEYNYLQSLFTCMRCGDCCRELYKTIMLTNKDMARLEQYNISIDRDNNMQGAPCRFFKENIGCSIYDERPEVCRCYPFFIEFACDRFEKEDMEGFVIILNYDPRCNGMKQLKEKLLTYRE